MYRYAAEIFISSIINLRHRFTVGVDGHSEMLCTHQSYWGTRSFTYWGLTKMVALFQVSFSDSREIKNCQAHNKLRCCRNSLQTRWWKSMLWLYLVRIWHTKYMGHYNDVMMSAMASQINSLTILYNRLFRRRSEKTSKLRVTGLCAGNPPVTGEFPAQMASNAENVSIWRRHHVQDGICEGEVLQRRTVFMIIIRRVSLFNMTIPVNVTLDISGSPIEFQWGSWKYPG